MPANVNGREFGMLDEAQKVMWALYKELDDKNAALNDSNAELDQFATIAGHDLQEPLRKVLAFGRMLTEEHGAALGGGGRDYLDRMQGLSLIHISEPTRPY